MYFSDSFSFLLSLCCYNKFERIGDVGRLRVQEYSELNGVGSSNGSADMYVRLLMVL